MFTTLLQYQRSTLGEKYGTTYHVYILVKVQNTNFNSSFYVNNKYIELSFTESNKVIDPWEIRPLLVY